MAYTTVPKSSAYFDNKLITGNGGTQNITGLNFQPDFTWIKGRDVAESHALFDAPRGVTKRLMSDTTGAETTVQGVTAFNSDGFTLGALSAVNQNNGLFASWNWKANGAGSANTDGTINTIKTSANTTSGFSISTYTGTGSAGTIGHGLGVAPTAIWIKKTSATEQWFCWNQGLTAAGGFIKLDTDGATSTNNSGFPWNPQATTFGLSGDGATNASSVTYIAYCFAEKQGFSKMGSYQGNASTDGTFVYTGFKPAFIILKNTASAGTDWQIYDNKRLGYNGGDRSLATNTSAAEETGQGKIDFLSNGFKLRTASGNQNASALYIYMAFAEEPLVSTNGQPATAR